MVSVKNAEPKTKKMPNFAKNAVQSYLTLETNHLLIHMKEKNLYCDCSLGYILAILKWAFWNFNWYVMEGKKYKQTSKSIPTILGDKVNVE